VKPYPEYKESGIEWIGEIPEGWDVKRLKFLSNIKTGDSDTVDREDNGKYPFFVRAQNVERINTYSYDGEAVLTAGDGVGVGRVFHYINGRFDYHQRVYKISDFKEMVGKCFYYYMKENFHKEVMKISAKSTVDSLRLPMFLDFPVVFGSTKEQKQIAKYLDHKTSKIDSLIEKKKRLIEFLKEERTAVINQAVTKGLDPDVPMKDSEVEWFGEIPAHWEEITIGHLGNLMNGVNKPKEAYGHGFRFVTVNNLYGDGQIDQKTLGRVEVSDVELERFRLKEYDILMARSSVKPDGVGHPAIIEDIEEDTVFSGFVIRFRTQSAKAFTPFMLWILMSSGVRGMVVASANTVAQTNISQNALKSIKLPLPPIIEQKRIVQHIKKETTRIDTIISKTEKEIQLVQEYRTALISEVVTGKIDVREETI